MWLSSCCLLIALVFSIVAVGLDYLLTVHGQSYRISNEISADVGFGHDEIRMTVLYQYDGTILANRTVIVSYSQVYSDLCVDKNLRNEHIDSTYCDDIQALESAGQTYYGFAVFAVVMIAIAFLMGSIITIARCACRKPMTIGAYFVSGFTTTSVVSSTVAMFVAWNKFSENAAALVDVIYDYYYPVAQFDTEWNDMKSGPSLICLYVAIAIGFIAILTILTLERASCVGRRNMNSRVYPRGGDSPALLDVEGQPNVQNWTIHAPSQNKTETIQYGV